MKLKAKLVHKYPEQNGISRNTNNPWRRQEMKFCVLRDDWSETSESIVASTNNPMFLDAPALAEGSVGFLGVWASAEEYNGRCYMRMNMNSWIPQNAEQTAQTSTFDQLSATDPAPATATAPTSAPSAATNQQVGSDLPF